MPFIETLLFDDDTTRARALGRVEGCIDPLRGWICPYAFEEPELRMKWFDGFSEGRIEMYKRLDLSPSGLDPRAVLRQRPDLDS